MEKREPGGPIKSIDPRCSECYRIIGILLHEHGVTKLCPTCHIEYGNGEVFCPVDATRLARPSELPPPELRDEDDPLVGLTLGDRYRILRRIGEGGMGIVYEAEHVFIEKRVALKVLRDDFSRRPDVVARFRQEAKSASRIGHQHIVDISDFGETPEGQSYFVMEMLDGEDLANVLERETSLSLERAATIVMQCCRALGAAHAKGIVHRDMKPENIFLARTEAGSDFVKIVDFGIAKMSDIETAGAPGRKLTKTGMIFGTPEYMSPEQAAGKELDHRVDVYALGIIFYEMLTGRVPFLGDSFMGVLTQHMFDPVPTFREVCPRLDCPPNIEKVILKALEKKPERRFASMGALGEAVEQALGSTEVLGSAARGSATTDVVSSPHPPPRRQPSNLRPLWMAAGLVALAGLAFVAFDQLLADDAPTAARSSIAPEAAQVSAEVGATSTARFAEMREAALPEADPDSAPLAAVGAAESVAPEQPLDAPQNTNAPSTTMVQVTVETQPSGASVVVDGRGTVCEPTPCSFDTPAGSPLSLRATRGHAKAEHTFAPTESATVELALRSRRRPPAQQAHRPDTSRQRTDQTDLKVPDIFQNR